MNGQGLTPARLSEIRPRAEAATPGPWRADALDVWTEDKELFAEPIHTVYENTSRHVQQREDAAFIAAARQDVPDLLAEVDRLTAALDVAEKAVEDGPHGGRCGFFAERLEDDCNCWKADYDAAKEAQK